MALTTKLKIEMLGCTCPSLQCELWQMLFPEQLNLLLKENLKYSFEMKCSSELHFSNIWSINNHIRQGNHYRGGACMGYNKCVNISINTELEKVAKRP